jgi:hypothetical protein
MRRISLALALFALLVTAAPVLAAPGCGAGWDLRSVDDAIGIVDWRIYTSAERAEIETLIASVDANGDELLCTKQFKPNRGQDKQWIGPEDGNISDYVVSTFLDNKVVGRGT